MTLLGVCGQLIPVVTNMKRLTTFILGGELVTTLETLGYVHFESGVLALKDAQGSSNPVPEINSAITCFRTAFVSYAPRHTPRDMLTALVHPAALGVRHRKACESAILTAICYKWLGKQFQVTSYAASADRQFHWYAHYWTAGMSKTATNKGGIHLPPWQSGQAQLDKERNELSRLRRSLEIEVLET